MQITVARAKLSEALMELTPLAGKNKVLTMLNNVKFVTKGNRIRLQTTDAETAIRKYIDADSIDQEGSFLVDCAGLNAFVNKTKGDTLTLILEDTTLTVKHAKGKAEFQTLPADDFVEPKQDDDMAEVTLPASSFARLITIARNFVGNDDLRPQMKPIRAIIEGGKLTLCATDTRKMFVDSIMLGPDAPVMQWYIEQSVFGAIISACRNQDDVVVKVSDKNASYRIGATTIFTQQTKGNYPDFNRVIPQNHVIDVVCDKSDIVDAIQRAILFTENVGLLKVSAAPMTMDIRADNLTKLSKAAETLPCIASSEISFGANAPILLECVKACADNDVKMELNDASRPIVFKDSSNPDRTVLCMPMSLMNPQ